MRRVVAIAGIMALVIAAGAFYFVQDPATADIMPRCWFKALTGWQCPGCGTQRAIHAALHGHLIEAVQYNAMLVVAVPLLILLLVAEAVRSSHRQAYLRINAPWVSVTLLVLLAAWWVVRNIIGC